MDCSLFIPIGNINFHNLVENDIINNQTGFWSGKRALPDSRISLSKTRVVINFSISLSATGIVINRGRWRILGASRRVFHVHQMLTETRTFSAVACITKGRPKRFRMSSNFLLSSFSLPRFILPTDHFPSVVEITIFKWMGGRQRDTERERA